MRPGDYPDLELVFDRMRSLWVWENGVPRLAKKRRCALAGGKLYVPVYRHWRWHMQPNKTRWPFRCDVSGKCGCGEMIQWGLVVPPERCYRLFVGESFERPRGYRIEARDWDEITSRPDFPGPLASDMLDYVNEMAVGED